MASGSGSGPSSSKQTTASDSFILGSIIASKSNEQVVPRAPPMPNPSAGSADPSSSFGALWGYITPALEHIVKSPTNDMARAPAIDVSYHMGVHTATYQYFSNQGEQVNQVNRNRADEAVSGADLYGKLDDFFGETSRELLTGAPVNDSDLIHYIIPCFQRYAAGARAVNRLLHYVNRHYVKRAVDEDKGWLRLNDVLEAVAKTIKPEDTRDEISKRLRERRFEELRKWGFIEGSTDLEHALSLAEACAEAASPLDRVVPVSSLATRRFRTDFFEPLLAVPKSKKGKNKRPSPSANGDGKVLPKGRLARAVKELLESKGGDEEEKRRLAAELAKAFRYVGVRRDHPLRKVLDKFNATAV